MHIIFEQWDALELFCRVISKYEDIDLKRFREDKFLKRYLLKYSSLAPCDVLITRIWAEYREKYPLDKSGLSSTVKKAKEREFNKRALHEFFYNIRESIPNSLDERIYDSVIEYIDDKEYADFPREESEAFNPSNQQRLFEDTKWIIYYFETDSKLGAGVAAASLELRPFAKAEIVIQPLDMSEKRIYRGSYYIQDDDEFLRLKLRLKKRDTRDLQIIIHLGTDDNFELAIGISRNVVDVFWAEIVLIEQIKKSDKFYPGFFPRSEMNEAIPQYVWKLFENPSSSYIELKTHILTRSKLEKWLENRVSK